jgi:PAS domain S-box-containing protein
MPSDSELQLLIHDRIQELEAANAALRQSEQSLATELAVCTWIHGVATQLITAQGKEALFEQILDAVMAIMHSDFASIQILHPERGSNGELRLQGERGFSAEATKRWEWVDTTMHTSCAEALRTCQRVAASDVRDCAFMAGSADLEEYLAAGIHAVQSTPLISRGGAILGIFSTHWRTPHELSISESRALDILARLAADIIERSRAEESQRDALKQLQFIAEHMTCGVARGSHDHRYLWVNRSYAAWLGLRPEDVAGRPVLDVIGQQGYDEMRAHIEKALSGEPEDFEARINYRGTHKHVHKSYMPTKDVNQNVDGWLAVIVDVTEARHAQAELFEKQKLESIGTVASGIAHDFNNLLGGVLAQTELAQAQLSAGLNPNEELNAIRNVALRGSEIVRELMIYAGKETAVGGIVDVSSIIQEMLPLFKVSVSKHAGLEIDLRNDHPTVRANDAQVRQILLNLVTNASDAIGEKDGTIRLTTERLTIDEAAARTKGVAEGDYLDLTVSDTGIGMSQETQAKMFEPFFSTKARGRGVGLAVVHGVVRTLGGAIRVTSELNNGTTFQILLPLAGTTTAATGDAFSLAGAQSCQSQADTVLVVDDEEAFRCAIGQLLRKAGFDVLEAADGTAATSLLKENGRRVSAILLDMNMPGLPTSDVIAEATEVQPNIKIILTSAYSEEMLGSGLIASQIRAFIRKPFQFQDLLKVLRSSLSS